MNVSTFRKKILTTEFLYFTFLTLLVSLPILAPIFSAMGLTFLSKPIYFLYSFMCHQFHSRSLLILDYQYAWCARDMGIWMGFLSAAIAFKLSYIKEIKWYMLAIFVLPIAADGGWQTIQTIFNLTPAGAINTEGIYFSNNLTRFLTGAWFGIGFSLFVTPKIIKARVKSTLSLPDLPKLLSNNASKVLLTMFVMFVTYFFLVQAWSVTSKEYVPTNVLDSAPKVQEDNFFSRRKYAECPNDGGYDLFVFWCR